MPLFERPWSAGVLLGCLCTLAVAGSGAAGCGDVPTADTGRVQAALTPPPAAPGRIPRVDLRNDGAHMRGLQRQPDGTYKTICIDAPEALRPRYRHDQDQDHDKDGNGKGGAR